MTKEAYYFSHDSNAHKDPKILKLRMKYGWEGYGIYWAIIETLREQKDYKWKSDDKPLLGYSFANGEPIVAEILDHCIEIGLLVDDGEHIYSESLLGRMNVYEEKRRKRAEAGRKGAQKRWGNSDSEDAQKQGNGSANGSAIAKNGKGKERKVNESKRKERYLDHVLLSDDEYKRLTNDYGKDVVDSKIEDLDNYIGSTGRRYKDHNKTLRAWLKKDAPIKQQPKKSRDQIEHEKMLQEMGLS